MRMILKSRMHHYLARVGIVLIAIALIVGTVSCGGGGGAVTYSLTMAVAPGGGGTATDLTNTSPYAAGTVVNIQAVAAAGYKFVSWTAPAGTFGSATAATTTFTMPAQAVTVTANFVPVYSLTMAVNPVGGGTATDLTGASPYPAGTVVNIKATAAAPYQFVSWTAPAGTFANANAAQTTFTMPAQNVTVTAHFVGPLDHFMGYSVDSETYIGENVTLEDQFGTLNATVEWALGFCNPAEKVHGPVTTPIWNPDHHFTLYTLSYEGEPQTWQVEVMNQFGIQNLTVSGPFALGVPTQKAGHEPPMGLDHYLIYMVDEGPLVEEVVDLNDEFGHQPGVLVYEPVLFANPVQKTHDGVVTEIVNPETHAVIYSIAGGYLEREIQVGNQFGPQALNVSGPYMLAVPSEKIAAFMQTLIWDWYDLDAVRDNLGGSYVLMDDLDSTTAGYTELASPTANGGKGWQPIGTDVDRFAGTFDGQGYEIRDLFINRPAEYYVGLFGVGEGGVIENVGVVNGDVTGYCLVGGLVGYDHGGYVSNCYATGSVAAVWRYAGGLAGISSGNVSNSHADSNVYCGEEYAGGLVAWAAGEVSNSYATGNVTGNWDVGGLIGRVQQGCTVDNCYSTGKVSGNWDVGGLVGLTLGGTVSNSFWDTQTSGQATSSGGTGKTTAQMKDIDTFTGAGWDIVGVANSGTRNTGYIWNIVDDVTYPFLSWQPV